MKKLFNIFLFTCFLFSCSKRQEPAPPYQETARTQKVTFKIYQVADYSSPVYDSTYAEVTLGVYKQSLNDTTRINVWDTVLVRKSLRQFPALNNPLLLVKNIPEVYESKQKARVYYAIKYDNRGANQVLGSNIPFTTGVDTLQVNVGL